MGAGEQSSLILVLKHGMQLGKERRQKGDTPHVIKSVMALLQKPDLDFMMQELNVICRLRSMVKAKKTRYYVVIRQNYGARCGGTGASLRG